MAVTDPDGQPADPRDVPMSLIVAHVDEERAEVARLSSVRELVFGAQDGLVSTLAVVAAVAAATGDRFSVLVAGLASALAGVFSMAVGEFLGSRSEERIRSAMIDDERAEVVERPVEAQAEVAHTFIEEGMDEQDAFAIADILGRHPRSLLSTMTSRELGLVTDDHDQSGGPGRAALVMGGAFALGGVVPLVPWLIGSGTGALVASSVLTGIALFALGSSTARFGRSSGLRGGLETLALAAAAGIAGYLFGQVLPTLLGFTDVPGA